MSIKRKIPNILTTIRLILVPVFMFLFMKEKYIISLIIFIIASVTDFIDGYLARLWHVESRYGRIVDPVADKSLMIGSIICLSKFNYFILIPMILEIVIAVTNMIYVRNGTKFYVSYVGKVKTACLMVTIAYSILNVIIKNNITNYILISITIILQLWVIIVYYLNSKKNKK